MQCGSSAREGTDEREVLKPEAELRVAGCKQAFVLTNSFHVMDAGDLCDHFLEPVEVFMKGLDPEGIEFVCVDRVHETSTKQRLEPSL